MKRIALPLFLLIMTFPKARGQHDPAQDQDQKNTSYSNSVGVVNTLKSNSAPLELSRSYADLAEALITSGDYPKASHYLEKAIEYDRKAVNSPLSAHLRRLAWVREAERKSAQAAKLYTEAAQHSADSTERRLNLNDARRLSSSPEEQVHLLQANNILLNTYPAPGELNTNIALQANAHLALNEPLEALEHFNALPHDNVTSNTFELGNNISTQLLQDHPALALDLQHDLLEDARQTPQVDLQVSQLRQLSLVYQRLDSTPAAARALREAYDLALRGGSLREARASLDSLVSFHRRHQQPQEASLLYTDFLSHLDSILARDSSLFDRQLFAVNEDRIAELEAQRNLQEELLRRRNRFSLFLLGGIGLLAVLAIVLLRAWRSIRRRNRQIALQALRKEMNPHFLFNSLNSVNQFIASNNEREANRYLSAYAQLMRTTMENSGKDHLPLSVEISQLRKYLDLEKLRFPDKFDYHIEVDEALDPEALMVPNMILQPNLENAIWHGLRYRDTPGSLRLTFSTLGRRTVAVIDDNGIGLAKSAKIKTRHQKMHQSMGLTNVRERIRLLNKVHKTDIRFEVTEKQTTEGGVTVRLEW